MNNLGTTSDITTVRQRVNQLLHDHFAERQRQAAAISPDYTRLWRTVAATASDGKRLRPYLAHLSYAICGGNDESLILRIGTAMELLHLCLLAHDDIIDRDFVRHGRPNIAGTYRELYASDLLTPAELDHYANSAALLAGDLLLSDAYQFLLSTPLPDGLSGQVTDLFQTAIFSVAGGELIDTEAPLLPVSLADSLGIAEYKTAYYSCAVPLAMGATLAGADPQTCERFAEAGRLLGIAYQLADDLLGVFGDERRTGKSNMGDLREAKRTYLLKKTYELADDGQRQLLDQVLMRQRHDDDALLEIKRIIVGSGAQSATTDMIDDYIAQAKSVTARIVQDYPDAVRLEDFIESLVGRDS